MMRQKTMLAAKRVTLRIPLDLLAAVDVFAARVARVHGAFTRSDAVRLLMNLGLLHGDDADSEAMVRGSASRQER